MAKKVTRKTKAAAKVGTKSTGTVANADGRQTVLKQICAKVGIDPKTARRVLRKKMRTAKEDGGRPEIAKFHTIKHRWIQSPKDATVIESVLREYAKAA